MGALAAQRQATEDIGKLLPGLLHEAFIEPVPVLWPFKSTKPVNNREKAAPSWAAA